VRCSSNNPIFIRSCPRQWGWPDVPTFVRIFLRQKFLGAFLTPTCITDQERGPLVAFWDRMAQGCQMEIKNWPNSLQKIAKLSKNSPNFMKWLQFYQNINFFTRNQSFKAFLSFALYFTRKRIGFRHFANISEWPVLTFANIFDKKCSIPCFYFQNFHTFIWCHEFSNHQQA